MNSKHKASTSSTGADGSTRLTEATVLPPVRELSMAESRFAHETFGMEANALRRPPVSKLGVLDVGTNSIHLVMAEISPEGDFRILGCDKQMVQLGKGGFVEHVLTDRAMNDGLGALKRFVKMTRLRGIINLKAVATSAVREAKNGGDFLRRVRDELGFDLRVISAEEEARLIYLAVRHAVDLGDQDHLMVDMGGGSLEIVVGNSERADVTASVKLGASRLAELFLQSDPPAKDELKALRRHINEELESLSSRIGDRAFEKLITTSGTIANVAVICMHRRGISRIEPFNTLGMDRSEVKSLLEDLSKMARVDRMKIAGLDERRVDSVLPATMLIHTLLRKYDISSVEHCGMALREGVIIDHIARHRASLRARATWPDPRTRSAYHLGERCGFHRDHAQHVSKLALSLFDQLAPIHRLNHCYRDLLRYACLLHDIGYMISYRSHHKHSYYLIRNGRLKGFSEREIEVIANLARYHRKGLPKKAHYSYHNLDKADRRSVRRLIPLIRLANALDRTHYSAIHSIECRLSEDCLHLSASASKDAELELWTANLHKRLFKKRFGIPIEITLNSEQTAIEHHEHRI